MRRLWEAVQEPERAQIRKFVPKSAEYEVTPLTPIQHKQHSPMCDPDLRAQHQTLLSSMMQNPATFLAMQQGLPNINEDTML